MRKIMICAAMIFCDAVFAQSTQPQEYTIKLTAAEVDIVGKGLGELPYKETALLIQKLREQIVAQQSAKSLEKKE